jgi:hypothetical protein
MTDGVPYVTDAAERDLNEIRTKSHGVYGDILQDIKDLIYRVHNKQEILGSKPKSWTVEISHDYVVAFSYSNDELSAGIWVQMVVKKDELEGELRAIAIATENSGG